MQRWRRRPAWAIILGVVVFLLTGSAISLGYRAASGVPYIAVLTEKLEDYAAHADEYDIVFVGSSQTFRHVDPAVIDAALAACGSHLTSYNFGVPALAEPELRFVIDFILRNRSERLKYVVVQEPVSASRSFANMMSDRGRYFRGWTRTPDAVRDVACYNGSRAGQALRIINNARAMAAEHVGLGRLSQALDRRRRTTSATYDPRYRDHAGYWPADQDETETAIAEREGSFMTEEMLADARDAHEPAVTTMRSCRAQELLSDIDAFRREGLQTSFFVSPRPTVVGHDRAIVTRLSELAPDLPIFDFNDPDARPEYYVVDLWADRGHLNSQGAARLSEALGAELCAWVRG